MRPGLFQCETHAWLLNFKRDEESEVENLTWDIDDKISEREVFTRIQNISDAPRPED